MVLFAGIRQTGEYDKVLYNVMERFVRRQVSFSP